MYQIFIVEDEHLIRQSIRSVIENMPGPYALCGEASDGEMALSIMQDLMPDILITDIRMPFLDGFELIRHLKALIPWLKIAIVSGYDDFEYARRAISLGVDMYLLKPVRAAELTKAIDEMARRIDERRALARTPDNLDTDELQTALHQHFMRQLLYGGADASQLIERARALNISLISPCYQAVLFSFDDGGTDARLLRSQAIRLINEANAPLYYFNEPDKLTLLLSGADTESLNEETYRIINIIRHELKETCPVVTAVISNAVRRLGAVKDAYLTANSLLKKAVALSPGRIVDANDTAQITENILDLSTPLAVDYKEKLLALTEADAPAFFRDTLCGGDPARFDSVLMRYSALIDLLKITVQLTLDADPGADAKDISAQMCSQYDILTASGRRDAFEKLAIELIAKAIATRREQSPGIRQSYVVHRAEEYVRENFRDPNISLISVAKHVGLSPAHFSAVFSQALGKPLIAYLTERRIERAKELLMTTPMRLSAIAMDIGYNDPNYFSHVFRKSVGVTPKEYRTRHAR